MPDPPDVGLVTRLVLENPWPLAVCGAALGAAMLLTGLRDGVLRRVHFSALPFALAVAVVAIGTVVRTSGEQAEAVVRGFVDDVVTAAPLTRTMASVAPDATIQVGSERNAALGIDTLRDAIARAAAYAIESNRITNLDAYSVADDRAVIHLACRTDAGWGPVVTRWVLQVEERGGSWQIARLLFVEMNGRTPTRF